MSNAGDNVVTYDRDLKPLFREKDRQAMLRVFDLWSLEDVRANAEAILSALATGKMPCDGPWPADHVELFRSWTEGGMEE